MTTAQQPHDGTQSQLDDDAAETTGASTPTRPAEDPPVPVSGQPTGDSTGLGTSPPGVQAGNARQPSIAVPGKPEGEVDTRR